MSDNEIFDSVRSLATTLGVASPESNDQILTASFIKRIDRAAKKAFGFNLDKIRLDAERYEFLRDTDNWGEDSGNDSWEMLTESHGEAFDDIVDSRRAKHCDDDSHFDNAL